MPRSWREAKCRFVRPVFGMTFSLKAFANRHMAEWASESLGSACGRLTELQKQELEFRTHQHTGTLVMSPGFKMGPSKEEKQTGNRIALQTKTCHWITSVIDFNMNICLCLSYGCETDRLLTTLHIWKAKSGVHDPKDEDLGNSLVFQLKPIKYSVED